MPHHSGHSVAEILEFTVSLTWNVQRLLYKPQTVSFALSEKQDFWHLCWAMLSERALSMGQVTSAIHQFCNVWVILNPCIPQSFISFQLNQLPEGIWLQ